jgi:hypothetical protein
VTLGPASGPSASARPASLTYSCYGLVLSSELELPDLGDPIDTDAPADIVVRLGPLTRPPIETDQLPYGLWRSDDRCGVDVPEVGRYEARAGHEVIIDPVPGVEPRALRLFLLGTVMGAVMMQRDHLVLHGNAFRVGDACAVVVGHSGAGKSTLAAEFDRRGFDVLSDDVVPINADCFAIPGYPRIKLWDDALERLGVETNGLERINDAHEKFQLPLHRNAIEALPLRWIYVLERHAGSELTIEAVHGPQPVARHLEQCARLASVVRLARVRRPVATMTAECTAAAILADIAENPTQESA